MRFNELGLTEPIVRAVAAEGYTTPTPIQKKAIPEVLAGRDVLGCAQTGTGKTGAFAMPILDRLAATTGAAAKSNSNGNANTNSNGNAHANTNGHRTELRGDSRRRPRGNPRAGTPRGAGRGDAGARGQGSRPRALVLAPTRELATQIYESFRTYGKHLALRHTVVFGGVSQFRQERDIRAGVDVLVATPGRLLDLMNQGIIDLSAIEVLVLDEADRMLDMGFIRDIRKVIERVPVERQTLFFSATMPAEIRGLANSILRDPVFIKVDPIASTVETIAQSVYLVTRQNKPVLLERLLRRDAMARTLIFTRTKHGADKLVKVLGRSGIQASAIHGNKNQNARTRALDGFKTGRMPVLIATDIASRGIDVDEITHVVNYDIPNIPETYVHRIGRTARAGASGIAFSFCDHEEFNDLRAIERLIGIQLQVSTNEPDLVFDTPLPPPARGGRQTARTPRNSNGGGFRGNRGQSGGGRSRKPAARGSNNGQPRTEGRKTAYAGRQRRGA